MTVHTLSDENLMAVLAEETCFCCNSKLGLGKFGEATALWDYSPWPMYIFTENNRFSHSAASFIHLTDIKIPGLPY